MQVSDETGNVLNKMHLPNVKPYNGITNLQGIVDRMKISISVNVKTPSARSRNYSESNGTQGKKL